MSSNLKLKLAALGALSLSAICIALVFAFDPWTGLAVFIIAIGGGAIAVHFLPEGDADAPARRKRHGYEA